MAKFDKNARTFETRVTFIRDIFANKYEPIEIMAHCISYKLDKSFLIDDSNNVSSFKPRERMFSRP